MRFRREDKEINLSAVGERRFPSRLLLLVLTLRRTQTQNWMTASQQQVLGEATQRRKSSETECSKYASDDYRSETEPRAEKFHPSPRRCRLRVVAYMASTPYMTMHIFSLPRCPAWMLNVGDWLGALGKSTHGWMGNGGDTSLTSNVIDRRMAAGHDLAVPGTGFRDRLKVVIG
ncbi:MAG: hypothetical protein LQ343_001688 [Gyalolechia ehrenbergii]|nr:MAG: hypothetical protein LQ343_001688 [Gyalolechia ehrenbergii]